MNLEEKVLVPISLNHFEINGEKLVEGFMKTPL